MPPGTIRTIRTRSTTTELGASAAGGDRRWSHLGGNYSKERYWKHPPSGILTAWTAAYLDKKGLSVLTAPAWTHLFTVGSEVAKDAVLDLIRRFMEADRPL